ncbi:hypothetical protein D9M69_413550 [compost metagenome]
MHGLADLAGAGLQVVDHLADFLHRVLGAPRQAAHLVGDHREAAPLFAGACRLDGCVEGQQVGLLGDRADHLEHRADLLAALGEVLHLAHGLAHALGELVDAGGGAADHREAVAGRLVGVAGGVGGLRGVLRRGVGGRRHLVQGGGHLVDLAELLLHAVAGLAGDQRRLVGGGPGVLHRALHLADHRLQLVEEAVEAPRQAAQLVAAGVVEAAGQVAFAVGDVLDHAGQAQQRAGDAARGEPDQGDAEQAGEQADGERQHRAFHPFAVQLALQGFGRRHQGLLRHAEEDAPGRGAVDRHQRFEHLDLRGVGEGQRPVALQRVEQLAARQAAAQARGVLAVAGDHPGRAEDADPPVAVVELAGARHGVALQAVEADVEADHGDGLAVLQQREGNAGDQPAGAGNVVEVGIEHAHPAAVARAGVEGVVWLAAGAGGGVGEGLLVADHRVQLAGLALQPVEGEAAELVAAEFGLVLELAVGAVQRLRLEDQVQAEQLGFLAQRPAQLVGQALAQGARVDLAPRGLFAQAQQVTGQALAVVVGVQELALQLQGLDLALGLQVEFGGGGQHLAAGAFDALGALLGLVQRQTGQQGDHQDQAQAGEQDDLALDVEGRGGHGQYLCRKRERGGRLSRPPRGWLEEVRAGPQNMKANTSWLYRLRSSLPICAPPSSALFFGW